MHLIVNLINVTIYITLIIIISVYNIVYKLGLSYYDSRMITVIITIVRAGRCHNRISHVTVANGAI